MAGQRAHSIHSFAREQDHTLIAYGTGAELPTNREAAEALQKAIRESGANFTVPIKSDKEVTNHDIRSNHVLLVGRPDSNALVKRFEKNLPIAFGPRSFVVRGKTYAHPDSAVIVAAENPLSKGHSLVVVAGMGAASTLQAAPKLAQHGQRAAEVWLLAHGEADKLLVLPMEVAGSSAATLVPTSGAR